MSIYRAQQYQHIFVFAADMRDFGSGVSNSRELRDYVAKFYYQSYKASFSIIDNVDYGAFRTNIKRNLRANFLDFVEFASSRVNTQ